VTQASKRFVIINASINLSDVPIYLLYLIIICIIDVFVSVQLSLLFIHSVPVNIVNKKSSQPL